MNQKLIGIFALCYLWSGIFFIAGKSVVASWGVPPSAAPAFQGVFIVAPWVLMVFGHKRLVPEAGRGEGEAAPSNPVADGNDPGAAMQNTEPLPRPEPPMAPPATVEEAAEREGLDGEESRTLRALVSLADGGGIRMKRTLTAKGNASVSIQGLEIDERWDIQGTETPVTAEEKKQESAQPTEETYELPEGM